MAFVSSAAPANGSSELPGSWASVPVLKRCSHLSGAPRQQVSGAEAVTAQIPLHDMAIQSTNSAQSKPPPPPSLVTCSAS